MRRAAVILSVVAVLASSMFTVLPASYAVTPQVAAVGSTPAGYGAGWSGGLQNTFSGVLSGNEMLVVFWSAFCVSSDTPVSVSVVDTLGSSWTSLGATQGDHGSGIAANAGAAYTFINVSPGSSDTITSTATPTGCGGGPHAVAISNAAGYFAFANFNHSSIAPIQEVTVNPVGPLILASFSDYDATGGQGPCSAGAGYTLVNNFCGGFPLVLGEYTNSPSNGIANFGFTGTLNYAGAAVGVSLAVCTCTVTVATNATSTSTVVNKTSTPYNWGALVGVLLILAVIALFYILRRGKDAGGPNV